MLLAALTVGLKPQKLWGTPCAGTRQAGWVNGRLVSPVTRWRSQLVMPNLNSQAMHRGPGVPARWLEGCLATMWGARQLIICLALAC